jgi:hypothetical protein
MALHVMAFVTLVTFMALGAVLVLRVLLLGRRGRGGPENERESAQKNQRLSFHGKNPLKRHTAFNRERYTSIPRAKKGAARHGEAGAPAWATPYR